MWSPWQGKSQAGPRVTVGSPLCFCFRPLQILISLYFLFHWSLKLKPSKSQRPRATCGVSHAGRPQLTLREEAKLHQRAREPRRPLVMGRCRLWCRERIPGPFELFIDTGCGLQSQLTSAMSSPPAAPQCPPAVPSTACLLPHLQVCPALCLERPSLSFPGS